jgi:prepilin-type processing-associated H-X9-DG protein
MEHWLSCEVAGQPFYILKYSELINPGPARTFVFVHENELGIDDARFGITQPGTWQWVNWPTAAHLRGGTLSFADGHVEFWKWRGNTVFNFAGDGTAAPVGDLDLARLQAAIPSQ